jgi:hypothetical protein
MTKANASASIADSGRVSFLIQSSLSRFNDWTLKSLSWMPADHNAVDSTLGYNFQTLHALVVLLGAGDDESVTIELTDDITLHHTPIAPDSIDSTRIQVSHSLKASLPEIKITTTKLWKTLRIWASQYDPKERYFLLTCASVAIELQPLVTPTEDRKSVQVALEKEANRVIDEVAGKIHAHEDRIDGCKAFIALSSGDRAQLLAQIILCVDSPNILAIDDMLDQQLRNIGRPEKRKKMIQRLRGYWMNRACLSLTGQMPKFIRKSELLQCLEDLANELAGNGLPDDFDTLAPPAGMPAPDLMRRQIELVNGGGNRIERSKRSHWKSRNQRQKWLEDDVSMASRLNEYDQKLVNTWNDRHGPMCDDTCSATDVEKQKKGCEILDWSHNDAPQWPFTFGRGLIPPFVTQGTYQDLANQLLVGWHPDFKKLLSDPGDKK